MKHVLVVILLDTILLFSTAGLAVPNFDLYPQSIGATVSKVYSPAGSGGFYFWIYYNYTIANVTLTFSDNLSTNTIIYVKLYNLSGDLIAVWNRTLTTKLPAFKEINVSPSSQVNISDVYDIRVVLNSKEYIVLNSSSNFELQVSKIGEGFYVGDICNPVTIINSNPNTLYNYTVKIVLNSSTDVLWSYINSTNVYFTTTTGAPLYYWVQQLNPVNEYGVLWVKLPSIPGVGNVTVCMHYGGVNQYPEYNDPEKVFLFFDDFSGTSLNLTKWNVHGTPTLSGGILYMSGVYQLGSTIYGNSTWIWTKMNLPLSYEVIMNASLSYPDRTISRNNPGYFIPGPFYIADINTTSGIGYGEAIEYYTYLLFNIIPITLTYDAWTNRSVYTGTGSVLNYASNPYTLNAWSIFEIYINSNGSVYTYQNETLMASYSIPATNVTSGPFGFGQITGRLPSEYDWIAIRKHVVPEPKIKVGHWYGALQFYPVPPDDPPQKRWRRVPLNVLVVSVRRTPLSS